MDYFFSWKVEFSDENRRMDIAKYVKDIKISIFDKYEIFTESLTYLLHHLNSRIGTLRHNDPNYGFDLNLHRYADIQAVYDAADGKCLNNEDALRVLVQNNLVASQTPRGWELSLLGDQVVACGKPFYAHPKYDVYDATVFDKVFLTSSSGRDVVWVSNQKNKKVLCYDQIDRKLLKAKMANPRNRFNINWSRIGVKDKPSWDYNCKDSVAITVCKNAVVVAGKSEIVALDLQDGKVFWSQAVPAAPVAWGLAIDRDGRAIVSLEDGQVMCLGSSS